MKEKNECCIVHTLADKKNEKNKAPAYTLTHEDLDKLYGEYYRENEMNTLEQEVTWWYIHVTVYDKRGDNIHLCRYAMEYCDSDYEETIRQFNKTCEDLRTIYTVIPIIDKTNKYEKIPVFFETTNTNERIAIVRIHPDVNLDDYSKAFQLYCDPSLDPQIL